MKDGHTKREHYIAAGVPEEEWGIPEFPIVLYDLWQWFLKLHGSRGSGLGPAPITEESIGWFFHTRRIAPQGWQLDAIRMLDRIALESMGEKG